MGRPCMGGAAGALLLRARHALATADLVITVAVVRLCAWKAEWETRRQEGSEGELERGCWVQAAAPVLQHRVRGEPHSA